MTTTPRPCHYDRTLDTRVTTAHTDDCPRGPDCPGHHGCDPCPEPHCTTCRTEHTDHATPVTCPTCVGNTRTILDDIRWTCRHLRWQAVNGGRDGRLVAGAPIPGGDAMIMIAPAGPEHENLIWSTHIDDDHRPDDAVPPLLVLAGWAEQVRHWSGHTDTGRVTITGLTGYLTDQLNRFAQADDGPDWDGFNTQMGALLRQLERILHDEQAPEHGVSCFECGRTLVRKFGKPSRCRHATPATRLVAYANRLAALGYPELGPTPAEVFATRLPCGDCDQGGIIDPSVGQSWECTGCAKQYTPGEYGNAVRRDLATRGPTGDGWTHITMAAEAASTMTGHVFAAATVRRWMDRGKVGSVCRWVPGASWGLRLVFWPDVADQAALAVERAARVEADRISRARQLEQVAKVVARGQDPKVWAKRHGVHPNRVRSLLDEIAEREAMGDQVTRNAG